MGNQPLSYQIYVSGAKWIDGEVGSGFTSHPIPEPGLIIMNGQKWGRFLCLIMIQKYLTLGIPTTLDMTQYSRMHTRQHLT